MIITSEALNMIIKRLKKYLKVKAYEDENNILRSKKN